MTQLRASTVRLPGSLAGRWARVFGRVVDGVVVSAVVVPVSLLYGPNRATWAFGLVVAAAYEVSLVAIRGRTLGCMATGIAVVRQDGAPRPGWLTATIRWFVPAATGILAALAGGPGALQGLDLVWGIAVYAPILGVQRRGLHDRAARTDVVRTR